jgi:hypothetical protein
LKGAINYNTYGSKLASNNGAVLKLVPGEPKPSLFLTDTGVSPVGPCRSCHALSANGMAMTANHHTYPGTYVSEGYDVSGPTPTLVLLCGILYADRRYERRWRVRQGSSGYVRARRRPV